MRSILFSLFAFIAMGHANAFEVRFPGGRVNVEPGTRIQVQAEGARLRDHSAFEIGVVTKVNANTAWYRTEEGAEKSVSDSRLVSIEVDYVMVFSGRVERGYKVSKINDWLLWETEKTVGFVEAVFENRDIYVRQTPEGPLTRISSVENTDYQFYGERMKRGPDLPKAVRACKAFKL